MHQHVHLEFDMHFFLVTNICCQDLLHAFTTILIFLLDLPKNCKR